jgi:O-antigen/teichoic acid export membrane protein
MNSLSKNSNQFSEQDEPSTCKSLIIASCLCALMLGLIAGIISYFVFGIMFLVQDYDAAHDCHGSNLWAFVLVTLIMGILNGNSAKNGKDNDSNQFNVGTLVCTLLLNIAMCIWGGIEIYSNSCDDLKTTQLYTFAQFVFVLYCSVSVLLTGIIIWIMAAICCYNENNESISDDIEKRSNLTNQLTFERNKRETPTDSHTIV